MNLIQPSGGGEEQPPGNKELISRGASQDDDATVDSPPSDNSSNPKAIPHSVSDESGVTMNGIVGLAGTPGGATAQPHPISLPPSLESLPRAEHFPTQRHRWNTNEEIAAVLINFDRHSEWLFREVKIRPKSGSMLLYSRKKVRYRRDGYCWKKRKDGKTTREDHMKLKVQGTECIYGCYVHSAILPTFHRRCYWLLQNPDIVLVHYLNVPYPDDAKLLVVASVSLWAERKEWSKEELISQLRPMFLSQDEPNLNNELEVSTAETVEAIVSQLMEKQRLARSGGGVTGQVVTNGHVQPQQPQPQPQQQPQHHHHNQTGTGRHYSRSHETPLHQSGGAAGPELNVLSESNRRISNGPGSLVRLEPRPPPPSTHSNNQVSPVETLYDGRADPSGRGASPPTSSSSSSSSSSTSSSSSSSSSTTSVNPFGGSARPAPSGMVVVGSEPIHHRPEPTSRQSDQLVSAKQEHVDYNYYHSACNANNPSQSSQTQNPSYAANGGCNGAPFPSFYSLTNPASSSAARRTTDELLSGQGFRLPMDCLFNETLDLSQDDIQRTLSANLSHETAFHASSSGNGGMSSGNGEMRPRPIEVGPIPACDDDLLVNLDAFDMLTEFSDLDCRDTIDSLISIQADSVMDSPAHKEAHHHHHRKLSPPPAASSSASTETVLSDITDYSPEWAPVEGGSKLLLTGSFTSPAAEDPYSILFDGIAVPAIWVQLGVLRCYCPPHGPGRVQLQVARQGVPITHPTAFEYRQLSSPPLLAHPIISGGPVSPQWTNSILTLLVTRLESLSAQLVVSQGCSIDHLFASLRAYLESGEVEIQSAEEQLVSICRQLVAWRWKAPTSSPLTACAVAGETNLLHLAAALGLTRVICTLLNWRLENSSQWLERELNPLATDHQGYTPLMWASAHGHRDVVALLAQWDPAALDVQDRTGKAVWVVARQRGHHSLAEELETRRILSVRRSTTGSEPAPPPPATAATKPSTGKPADSTITTRQMLMAKRSSVDSVPNSSQDAGSNAQPGYWRRPNVAKSHKLSRDDRSYSLPLGSNGPAYSSGRNSTGSNISSLAHDPSLSPHMDSSASLTGGSSTDGLDGSLLNGRSSSPYLDIECLSDDGLLTGPSDATSSSQQVAPAGPAPANGPGARGGARRESISSVDLQQHLSPLTSIEQNTRVLTLAEQIIAAIPDRIKNETEDMVVGWSPGMDLENSTVSEVQSFESSIDLASINDGQPSLDAGDLTFDFNDQQYRYCETATPSSSLSPASSSCLQSPCSFSVNSPSPPPTTADFSEFLQASASLFVRDFSNLTLSDHEQRELYEAAKTIQKAYRSYVGRKKAEEQEKERAAAVIIQNYYRRYKQYVYLKQMTKAAVVIQNQFRSYYYEQKRFKKNLEAPSGTPSSSGGGMVTSAAAYRNYRETSMPSGSGRQSREGTPTSSALKRTYSQRRQHQAARKIQQFMRQSKNNPLDMVVKSVAERESVAIGSRAGRETNCGGSVVVGTGVAENNSGGGGLPFVSGINSSGSGSTSSLSGFHRS